MLRDAIATAMFTLFPLSPSTEIFVSGNLFLFHYEELVPLLFDISSKKGILDGK